MCREQKEVSQFLRKLVVNGCRDDSIGNRIGTYCKGRPEKDSIGKVVKRISKKNGSSQPVVNTLSRRNNVDLFGGIDGCERSLGFDGSRILQFKRERDTELS